LIPPETDLVPFDQLEKCRKPDYRHFGGGSRRCDEMSFLLHTSGSVGDLGGQPPRSTRPLVPLVSPPGTMPRLPRLQAHPRKATIGRHHVLLYPCTCLVGNQKALSSGFPNDRAVMTRMRRPQ